MGIIAAEVKRFCHDLPEEIWTNVLLRLPPRILKSCKFVCKSWYAVINNPSFIKRQLDVSIENNKHSSPITLWFSWAFKELSKREVLTGRYEYAGEKQVLSLVTIHKDDSDGDHLPCVVEEFNLPFTLKVTKKLYPVFLSATHCNGVICFYDAQYCSEETNVILCNVELGEFKLFRTPHLHIEFSFAGAGFGYDPKADTYKYVKLFTSFGFNKQSRALVHTLGTDSWREVDLKDTYCWLRDEGLYCRGVYYWRSAGLQGSEHTVLSFDLSEEKFNSIKLPLIAQRANRRFKRLTIWKESVVFFISTERSHHSTLFEMWVMVHDFNGVEGFTSWSKHLTIGSLVCIYSPLAFWKDDELLMQTRDGRIVSYNLHTQKLKELSIPGSLLPDSTRAFSCLRSLVSVKGGSMLTADWTPC